MNTVIIVLKERYQVFRKHEETSLCFLYQLLTPSKDANTMTCSLLRNFQIITQEASYKTLGIDNLVMCNQGCIYAYPKYSFLAGEYGIHVKYNDEHVPDSPAMVYIAPESKDAKLVTIQGLRDRGLPVSGLFFFFYFFFLHSIIFNISTADGCYRGQILGQCQHNQNSKSWIDQVSVIGYVL